MNLLSYLVTIGFVTWTCLVLYSFFMSASNESRSRTLKTPQFFGKSVKKWLASTPGKFTLTIWASIIMLLGITYGIGADFETELRGILLTVVLVDGIRQISTLAERKREILQQIGSDSIEFSLEATRIARLEGWIFDGSLRNKAYRRANLSRCNFVDAQLQGVDFSDARMNDAILIGANLDYANVMYSTMTKSNWFSVVARDAKLDEAKGDEINFRYAVLDRSTLNGAEFRNSDFFECKAPDADFGFGDFSRSLFSRGVFTNAKFNDASMDYVVARNADFSGSTMTGTSYVHANLLGSSLQRAWLVGARFTNADLRRCKLEGAYLLFADLSGARLEGVTYDDFTDWKDCSYDVNTVWPEGFDPDLHGCVAMAKV